MGSCLSHHTNRHSRYFIPAAASARRSSRPSAGLPCVYSLPATTHSVPSSRPPPFWVVTSTLRGGARFCRVAPSNEQAKTGRILCLTVFAMLLATLSGCVLFDLFISFLAAEGRPHVSVQNNQRCVLAMAGEGDPADMRALASPFVVGA